MLFKMAILNNILFAKYNLKNKNEKIPNFTKGRLSSYPTSYFFGEDILSVRIEDAIM